MRIKLNSPMTGHRTRVVKDAKTGKDRVEVIGDFMHRDGDIIDWPDKEAKTMIERGHAEPVSQSQQRG